MDELKVYVHRFGLALDLAGLCPRLVPTTGAAAVHLRAARKDNKGGSGDQARGGHYNGDRDGQRQDPPVGVVGGNESSDLWGCRVAGLRECWISRGGDDALSLSLSLSLSLYI